MMSIVVIAGSAGSLDPLRRILASLPPDCAAAVFVTTHIGPHRSVLPTLLARSDGPPTGFPSDGEPILGGRIYVAPSDVHMVLEPGVIRLARGPKVHHTRPAADPLFKSAAEHYGRHVLGVVLSGGDGDGAEGLRLIYERGGIALVQRPDTAKQPHMPLHAIAADHPDAVLSIEELAGRVRSFAGQARSGPAATAA